MERRVLGPLVAVALSLVLAVPATASSWAHNVRLSSDWASGGGLVTLGSSTAVAVYRDNAGVAVRRSTDAGVSWGAPANLAPHGSSPVIAGRGSNVDVAWTTPAGRLRLARSIDGGASFGPSKLVAAPRLGKVLQPAIARGPRGLLVIAFMHVSGFTDEGGWTSSRLRLTVSHDGGATFRKALTLEPGARVWGPQVAVGDGVIYAAFSKLTSTHGVDVRLLRSFDRGASFGAGVTVLKNYFGSFSFAAAGSEAYVGYTVESPPDPTPLSGPLVKRSGDKGGTWAAPTSLDTRYGHSPVVSVKNGVARAAYIGCAASCLCSNGDCSDALQYRQTTDGATWSEPETVASSVDDQHVPRSVGFARNAIVLYDEFVFDGCCMYIPAVSVRARIRIR